jgi:hypothetical protein
MIIIIIFIISNFHFPSVLFIFEDQYQSSPFICLNMETRQKNFIPDRNRLQDLIFSYFIFDLLFFIVICRFSFLYLTFNFTSWDHGEPML